MKRDKIKMICLVAIVKSVILLAVFAGAAFSIGQGQPQTFCPIMGGEIDRSAYVDYAGKRIYFCCPGCKATFLETPEKYLKEMESRGIVLEKVSTPKEESVHKHGNRGANPADMDHEGHMHEGGMH